MPDHKPAKWTGELIRDFVEVKNGNPQREAVLEEEMAKILIGDAKTILQTLPDKSIHCCVTSPPYWGLRDYGVDGQMGLEATPEEYVEKMVSVFGEVRRVLRDDGTLPSNKAGKLRDTKGRQGSAVYGPQGRDQL